MRQPIILPYRGIMPKIDPTAFVAAGVVVIGDVEIGAGSSVWFGCVVRGDVNKIRIGKRSNIQDGSVIHVAAASQPASGSQKMPTYGYPTLIGDDVTVGHMTLLHACALESNSFIGMKACVMDGAKVESGGMLAAGALLTPGKIIKSGQLWIGSPAKFSRELTEADRSQFDIRSNQYAALAEGYRR